MTNFTFDAYDLTSGAFVAPLVDISAINVSFVYSDLGAIRFSYPREGRYAAAIQAAALTGLEVVSFYNGVEIDDGRFIVQAIDGDQIVEDDRFWKYAGIGWGDVLRKVLVYAKTTFTAKTAGEIVKTLLATASGRGAFGAVNTSTSTFTNTLDSAGAAWTQTYNIEFDTGTTLRDVLTTLSERAAVDYRFTGRSLKLYKGNTLGTVLNDVVIAPARGLSETPVKWSLQDTANVLLMEGDGGVTVERTTAGARREEAFVQQSGVSDTGTLSVLGDSMLVGLSVTQEQRTAKLEPGSATQAIRDFKVGDSVMYAVEEGVPAEIMRVRQITVDIDADGNDSASVVMNDRILEGEIRRAQSLQLLAGGVDAGSGGTTTEPPPVDTTIPSAPTSLTVSSTAYLDAGGVPRVVVTGNWAAVTTNVGGSTITDLAGYALYMRNEDNGTSPLNWIGEVRGGATTINVGGVPANVFRRFTVRAFDQSGNYSADSNEFRFQTANDTAAPNAPSTPTVAPYLGQLRIAWNGLDGGGGAPPIDFDRVEVHVSTTTGFTPSSATKIDEMRGAGVAIATDLAYGTTYFVKFVAYDKAGNASTPSAQASGIPETVTGLDIAALTIATSNMADLAISTAKIADAAIINAKIAALAVDDAKIGSVSAGKITVGTLAADITVSARIKTANTGARVELNSSGLQAFNSAGTQTVDIKAADGSATILGVFKTGIAGGGSAFMTIDDSTDRSTIKFWEQTGTRFAYINSPVAVGGQVGLGLNTGNFDLATGNLAGGTQGFARLYMNNVYTQLARVEADQDAFGGEIFLNHTSASMRRSAANGVHTGGEVYVDAASVQASLNSSGLASGGALVLNSSGALLGKRTGGTDGPGGRLRAETSIAAFEMVNSSGAGLNGMYIDSSGVVSFGTYVSTIGWSFTPASGWTTVDFNMYRWGGYVFVHVTLNRTGATISSTTGDTTDVVIGTITSSGNLPETEHPALGGGVGGLSYVGLSSAGDMTLRALIGSLANGNNYRATWTYFRP